MSERAIDKECFQRALSDIIKNGDNDVTPRDLDARFLNECKNDLITLSCDLGVNLYGRNGRDCASTLDQCEIASETLMAPAGVNGFRFVTKIHPFWNLYVNAIAVYIAREYESRRSDRVYSYRYSDEGDDIFHRNRPWNRFQDAAIAECEEDADVNFVVHADISGFYDRAYHHRIENVVDDVCSGGNIATQVIRILSRFSNGRSYGLPVGGQFSRVVSEVLLGEVVDKSLTAAGVSFHRYVDDFIILGRSKIDAYEKLESLARSLQSIGLSLNRLKTNVLSSKHFIDSSVIRKSAAGDEISLLRSLDLHFDPYSDDAKSDYEEIRSKAVEVDIEKHLQREVRKAEPDGIVLRQVSRLLEFNDPETALSACKTLLGHANIHSFRANWASVIRGVGKVRAMESYSSIHDDLDVAIDDVIANSGHLLRVDTNLLHFLNLIRSGRTDARERFVRSEFSKASSSTVRRSCIDCWRNWRSRDQFLALVESWSTLGAGEKQSLFFAAGVFGDDGFHFQKIQKHAVLRDWDFGGSAGAKYAQRYSRWATGFQHEAG